MSDEADRTLRVVDFMPFEEHQLVTSRNWRNEVAEMVSRTS